MYLVPSLKDLNCVFTVEYALMLRSTTRMLHEMGLERRYGDRLGVCVTYLVSKRNHRILNTTTRGNAICDIR